ncbi:hypothetical protein V6N13_123310 [Hibiscus sabdariffa]
MDPGLIYDIEFQQYVDFLCSLGYNETQMKAILRQNRWDCSRGRNELNYPSFMSILSKDERSGKVKKFSRVVTNVGDEESNYEAMATSSNEMTITVEPATLKFSEKYQKQNFVVSVEISEEAPPVVFGFIKWSDQHSHEVSSPIVVLNF